jgi:hypothetical protein
MCASRIFAVMAGVCLGASLAFCAPQNSQSASPSTSQPPTGPSTTVPRLIKFSGVLKSVGNRPQASAVNISLALYELQQGGSPLWSEAQTVSMDEQGRYTVLLGATQPEGLPLDLFASGKALWLGVQTQTADLAEQPRVLLVAVPYALKAADADTLGGKPASAYALAEPEAVVPSVRGGTTASVGSTGRSGGSSARVQNVSPSQPFAPCGTVTSDGTATPNRIALFTTNCNIENSEITDTGTKIGIGTATPTYDFDLSKSQNQDTIFRVRNPNPGSSARANLRLEADATIFSILAQSIANGKSLLFQAQNDNNLAFQQISNSPITFFTNNLERLRILGNGNVGIGTATPNAAMEENGTAKFDQAVTFVQPITSTNQLISAVATGTAPLQVTSTTQVNNLNANFLQGHPASDFQPAGAYATLGSNTFSGTQTLSSGDLALRVTTSAIVGVIDMGGSSFIHACCPNSLQNTFVGPGAGNFTADATPYGGPVGGNTGIGWQALQALTSGIGNTASGDSALYLNNTGVFNTASGDSALYSNTTGNYNTALGNGADVASNNLTHATVIGACATVSSSNALTLGAPAGTGHCPTQPTANTKVGIDVGNPSNIFTVLQGGGHAIADGWDTYSSRRWKSNIHTIHGALGKVERLRGVQYTYTANGHHDIGMIAEEVGKVVPEVVSYEANGKDAQGIDYARLTALLVQAVKEQQAEIEKLRTQVQALQRDR